MRPVIAPVLFALFTLILIGCRPQAEPPGIITIEPLPVPPPPFVVDPPPPVEPVLPDLPAVIHRNYLLEGGLFELPVIGATAFAAVRLNLRESASITSELLFTMDAGQPFVILEENGEWWRVEFPLSDGWPVSGWVMKRFTMINLPDIIPSLVFNNTNTFYSLFRSSGFDVPGITGMALYHGWDFNGRFERYEFIMPVLYATAHKVMAAQQAALADGRTLVIYEAFRPHDAHEIVFANFLQLFNTNATVRENIQRDGFSLIRFLAPSPYTHQRGTAVDVTLARILNHDIRIAGNFSYIHVTEYIEYQMQSPMHELSLASAIFVEPVVSHDLDAWRAGVFRDTVTEGTRLLIDYMDRAGFTPLSSEWWHFNDIPNTDDAVWMGSVGRFNIERTYSRPPW